MKVGMLTGGGDCPGLNAVIRAIVRKGSFHYEDEFVGFLEGWRGLLENKSMPLDLSSVVPALAGPRRPQDMVPLSSLKRNFQMSLPELLTPAAPAARSDGERP